MHPFVDTDVVPGDKSNTAVFDKLERLSRDAKGIPFVSASDGVNIVGLKATLRLVR